MMKLSKKLLSLLLCAIMVLGSVAIGGGGFAEVLDAFSVKASAAKVTSYSQGDIIEFGWYPQSEETNTSITDALTSSAGNTLGWNSYGYYSGTGDLVDGQMKPSDYMRYKDVMYGGTKYRGVVFVSYRPYHTGYTFSSDNSYQDDNGYTTGNVYWFKYEPIKWRVLDPASGMVMSETILDTQAYNNFMVYNSSVSDSRYYCFGNSAQTYYASDYANSSIRQWLNDDFYNTAFTDEQKSNIKTSALNNDGYYTLTGTTGYEGLDSASTNDKVFLLSYDEVLNSKYGFSTSDSTYDSSRQLKGSDYAKCQGLYVDSSSGSSYDGCSNWRLRSSGYSTFSTCYVGSDGVVSFGYDANSADGGVRPALILSNLESNYADSEIGSEDYIYYGTYPQTDVTDSLGAVLNHQSGTWISYNYYSRTGEWDDGQMKPSNYMRYKDVSYNGNKYRAVTFDTYRPYGTGDATSTSCETCQVDNGYYYGNVYWFKYEPIKWRILDPSTGLIMCDTILDSQAYNNYILSSGTAEYGDTAYWGDAAKNYYANNYAKSSIREWLNKDFYNTAFSFSQQSNILYTTLDNSTYSTSYSACDSESTTDKVFLLSYDEVKTAAYGFNSSASTDDSARRAKGTDYAKCQGLYVFNDGSQYDGNSFWWLRSPIYISNYACVVNYDGGNYAYYDVSLTLSGVRPALRLNLLEIMKDEAKAELAEAKMNAVSDEAKTILDNAIASVENAADVNDVVAITSSAKSDAENADTALADAKAAAKTDLAAEKNNTVSDEAKTAIDTAIENVDKATNLDAVASAKAEATSNAENADTALAGAKAAAKTELEEAKKDYVSDEAKAAVDTAIANVDKATNLDAVASAKAEGTSNAENADNAYAEKIKFDNVNIKVAGAQTVDYRSIVTITATATNVPDDCKLVLYVNGSEVKTGDNKSVSYEYDEIKSDINYTVKIIDANGKVQKDSNGNELTKDGGKITCNAGFFKKLIAFFKGLFKSLPKVEVKP